MLIRSSHSRAAVLFLLLTGPASAVAAEPTPAPAAGDQAAFEDHRRRGDDHFRAQRYADALKEFETAYAIVQRPSLLYDLGLANQRLGESKPALAYYERYLTAQSSLDPSFKKEVEESVTRLRIVEGGPAFAAPGVRSGRLVGAHFEPQMNRPLIAIGAALVGQAYVASIVTGSIMMASGNYYCCSYNGDERLAGGLLLIPILGPYISSGVYRDPILVIFEILGPGLPQLGGLAMIIAGTKLHHKALKLGALPGQTTITPYAYAGGGGLVAAGRF